MMGLTGMSNVRSPMIQGGEFEREDYEDLRTQLENLGKIGTQTVTLGGKEVEYALSADTFASPGCRDGALSAGATPELEDLTLCVGEGFAGPPFSEVAHIDLCADAPVEALSRSVGLLREDLTGDVERLRQAPPPL